LVLVAVGAGILAFRNTFGPSREVAQANERFFVDAETGKPFKHDLTSGEEIPVRAPSGKNTGFPAELCFWTKDGKPKTEPTAVLMNAWVGKPGPTFCPDCGRLVVGHNPPASADRKPPPTKEEYKPRAEDEQR
jgi:hypothetical protein